MPDVKPGRDQLVHELAANRDALEHLMDFHLHESAVNMQRRAIEIKALLATDPTSWEQSNEKYEMQEVLADILLQRDSHESWNKALNILRRQVCFFTSDSRVMGDSISSQDFRKIFSLHVKLEKAYKEIGQLDLAMPHLRRAFAGSNDEFPSDLETWQEIGYHLLEVYEKRVQDSDGSQRAVCISQLQGFRNEMETAFGRPLTQHLPECSEALSWCENDQIMVHKAGQIYKFDVLDPDIASSPLHIAAERCHDKRVLQQMVENSESLENLNEENKTPLLVAVENSNSDAISLLIQNRASLKARDNTHQTALHKSKGTAVTDLLLQTRLNRTDSVSGHSRSSGGQSHRPSVSSSATAATGITYPDFPPEDELHIDAQDIHEKTPLWNACSAGRAKTVDLLLSAGGDPDKCRHGTSPLAAAIESKARSYLEDPKRRVRIVTALVQAGADTTPGKEILRSKPKGIDYKRLLHALDASEDRPLLRPTSMGS